MSESYNNLVAALADRYAIDREIGSGGMATVYLADDIRHARKVAVKVMRPELAESVGSDRFLREIRTTANLRHPHIVPLYDSGEAGGFLYYVMPYVAGESLEQRLDREGQLSVEDTVKIADQVADALGYAHELGLLHRDIKPANIMLERGHAVVTDFGIARAVSEAGQQRLTNAGLAIGTAAYMSPEQSAADERLDARSDLYSLACVVYEMLAGQPPFTGPTAAAVMARHALDPLPPLATVRAGLPANVVRAVETALSKVPADRFRSLAHWAEALKQDDGSAHRPAVVRTSDQRPERPELAIAVLPIRASSDDSVVMALADGLTEEITAGLTRFSYLDVVGGDQGVSDSDPGVVARRLGARYLLSGRIRRSGRTGRVAIKLIDAESGSHLWAESYDTGLEADDMFEVQDRLTDRIVATVADQQGVLMRGMMASVRDKPVEEMTALDAIFLTFDYYQQITPELHRKVRAALERAVELEPGSADAWACLSQMYCEEHKHDFNARPDSLERALTAGQRAADIDKTCQPAYYALAQAYFFRRELDRFRIAAERAAELNPRAGNTVAFMGILRGYAGDLDEGVELIRRVLTLNPHHPGWYRFGIWYAHFARLEYQLGLEVAQAINLPGYYPSHSAVAACAGHLGRMDIARDAIRDLLAVYPEFQTKGAAEIAKWTPDADVLARYLEGIRLAGLEVSDA